MPAALDPLPDLSVLDVHALRDLVLSQHEQLRSRETEIENLKLLVIKLKRMQFGRKSEKLDRHIAQLELALEDLESTPCTAPTTTTSAVPDTVPNKPARRPLPQSLPRVTKTHAPKQDACPECGGSLRP